MSPDNSSNNVVPNPSAPSSSAKQSFTGYFSGKKQSLFTRKVTSPPDNTVTSPTIEQDSLGTLPKRRARHSLSASVTDFGTNLRRSASLRTTSTGTHSQSSHRHKPSIDSSSTGSARTPDESSAFSSSPPRLQPTKSASLSYGPSPAAQQRPSVESSSRIFSAPQSSKMAAVGSRPPTRPGGTSYSNASLNAFGSATHAGAAPAFSGITSASTGAAIVGQQIKEVTFQHIHETASKRISTLDYLRKAHEGHLYWFNTLLFPLGPTSPNQSQPSLSPTSPTAKYVPGDVTLSTLPSHTQARLARRATNYLLLGFSLPTVLDLNSQNAGEFLRALNALMTEYEAYQSIHNETGSTSLQNSLGRAKVAGLFRRGVSGMGVGKGRRASGASETPGLGISVLDEKGVSTTTINTMTPGSSVVALGFGASSQPDASSDMLLPGEEYSLLSTPNLPFDPDFLSTFSTLCDTLIDVYTKLLQLIQEPSDIQAGLGELFQKADGKIRKVLVQGIVREFEEESRRGVRREVGGLGRVVLGGLM